MIVAVCGAVVWPTQLVHPSAPPPRPCLKMVAHDPPTRRASASSPSLAGAAPSDDESTFSAWLASQLAEAPSAHLHEELFADVHACVLRWRRRYRGNPRLWRSLKAERIVKEVVEAAPVLTAAREVVACADGA